MPSPINVPITPPRVAFIDPRTGNVSREWYMFFLSLFQLTGGSSVSLDDLQKGPPPLTVDDVTQIINQIVGDLTPAPGTSELQAALDAVRQELQLLPRQELGTMAALQQANLPWVTFDTTAEGVPPDVGTVAWDGGTTLGIQMTPNVLQQVGESQYFYIKADSTITKGQLIMFTGAVGASGVIRGAPATGLTDGQYLMGIAAENIASNGFGLVTSFGHVRGWNTTGAPVGEVWADGDILYYNPSVAGGLTKTQPTAPNVKATIAVVVNAAPAGSGDVFVRISTGSVLGDTDSNVQFGTLANNDLIQYDSALQYWKNVAPSSISIGTATNLAGGAAGSVPYQTGPGATTFRSIGTADQVFRVNAGATAPEWVSPAALTKVDDTNVTLTLGGNPTNALLAAASLTLGWTGQLAVSRGGTGSSTASGARTNLGVAIGTDVQAYSANLAAIAGLTPTLDNFIVGNGTTWILETPAQARTSLGGTTVGQNMFTLTNPSAVTFPRFNADNTVSALDAATFRTAIGAGTGSGTVTSVATGTGLTGGPITGTGTISFSTAAVGTWAATPSSANLAAAMTDETGSGSLVFATRPSFANTIGVGGATAAASGAGVSFPASVSLSTDVNTLDDYEEGTWTPAYTPASGSFTSITVASTGTYVKIGKTVYFWCQIRTTAATTIGTASGILYVTGLPFTADSNGGGGCVYIFQAFNLGVAFTNLGSVIAGSESRFYLSKNSSNSGVTYVQATEVSTAAGSFNNLLGVFGMYQTNS